MSDEQVTLRDYFEALRKADQLAVATALEAAEKAVLEAERQAQRWRDNANEWRDAMNDREREFLTRKEFYTMIATAVTVIGLIVVLL